MQGGAGGFFDPGQSGRKRPNNFPARRNKIIVDFISGWFKLTATLQ
jgi:hypothetical protein